MILENMSSMLHRFVKRQTNVTCNDKNRMSIISDERSHILNIHFNDPFEDIANDASFKKTTI